MGVSESIHPAALVGGFIFLIILVAQEVEVILLFIGALALVIWAASVIASKS